MKTFRATLYLLKPGEPESKLERWIATKEASSPRRFLEYVYGFYPTTGLGNVVGHGPISEVITDAEHS